MVRRLLPSESSEIAKITIISKCPKRDGYGTTPLDEASRVEKEVSYYRCYCELGDSSREVAETELAVLTVTEL